jgi:hypothetical protein
MPYSRKCLIPGIPYDIYTVRLRSQATQNRSQQPFYALAHFGCIQTICLVAKSSLCREFPFKIKFLWEWALFQGILSYRELQTTNEYLLEEVVFINTIFFTYYQGPTKNRKNSYSFVSLHFPCSVSPAFFSLKQKMLMVDPPTWLSPYV